MSSSRVFAASVGACLLLSTVALPNAAQAQEPDRRLTYEIKASYIYKFTAFTDWPAAAFEGPASPFRLCVGGRDPFGGALDRAAQGRRVGDHPMIVVRLPAVAKDAGCHILFLGPSRTQTPQQMLAAVDGQPVLTVADEGLEAPSVMVQFVTVEGRIRFEIRADAAQAEGLSLSSKLLALSVPPRDASARDTNR